MLRTNAKQTVMMPNPKEMLGINHPGPKYLQAMFDGISNTM
jgi:hypothetical protein